MSGIFRIIEIQEPEEGNKKGISLGINVKIADQEVTCPVSRICLSYEELAKEVETIKNDLKRILEKAETVFKAPISKEKPEFTPEMSPEQIWSILSQIDEESSFIKSFNGLDDNKRRELAEHILTRCNIFSGKGSTFSERYNSISGLLE